MVLETTQILATVATLFGVGGALSVLLQARQMRARGAGHVAQPRLHSGCSGLRIPEAEARDEFELGRRPLSHLFRLRARPRRALGNVPVARPSAEGAQ